MDKEEIYSIGFTVVLKHDFSTEKDDPLSQAMIAAVMDAMTEVRNREEFVDREVECQCCPVVIQSDMVTF